MAAVEEAIAPIEGVEDAVPAPATETPETGPPPSEDPAPKKGKEVKPKKAAAPKKPRSAPAHPSYLEVLIIYHFVSVFMCLCLNCLNFWNLDLILCLMFGNPR